MNARTITRIGPLLMLVTFAVSCMPAKTTSTSTSIAKQASMTATPKLMVTTTPMPTRPALPSTIAPIAPKTATLTPVGSQPISKWPVSTCLENGKVNEPPPGYGVPGSILYHDILGHEYGLIGGIPLTKKELSLASLADSSQEGLHVFGFSPNGQWMAYGIYPWGKKDDPFRNSNGWRIGLFLQNGEHSEINLEMGNVLDVIPEYVYLTRMEGNWVSEELLYTPVGFSSGEYMSYSIGFILDPFKGTWREDLLAEIPEMDRTLPFAISPDSTLILYYQTGRGPVLWDIAQRRALWVGKPAQFQGILIRWSPDSSMVAYDTGTEQIIVDRDGNAKVSLAELISQNGEGYTFQWSPDSQYLAFDVYINPVRVLNIYDTLTEQIVYNCPYGGSTPYWSPDGNYLAFGVNHPPSSYIAAINLQDGTVTKLADDVSVLGWSDKFPVVWPSDG